jgi:hypothetical protein
MDDKTAFLSSLSQRRDLILAGRPPPRTSGAIWEEITCSHPLSCVLSAMVIVTGGFTLPHHEFFFFVRLELQVPKSKHNVDKLQ